MCEMQLVNTIQHDSLKHLKSNITNIFLLTVFFWMEAHIVSF